jgi:hypothetical protein
MHESSGLAKAHLLFGDSLTCLCLFVFENAELLHCSGLAWQEVASAPGWESKLPGLCLEGIQEIDEILRTEPEGFDVLRRIIAFSFRFLLGFLLLLGFRADGFSVRDIPPRSSLEENREEG